MATHHHRTGSEDTVSDDDFDNLLATIPLPGLPPPLDPNPSHPANRAAHHTDADFYEPIGFGEIAKYMNHKRQKLKVQEEAIREADSQVEERPQFFAGLVIHVNGYTSPPLSEIRSMIVLHGGTFMAYLDHKSVLTHIVATSLTPKKREEFRAYKVVTPEWVVQSVAAGRLLNWSEFRLLTGTPAAQNSIARGEATGGRTVGQKTLFALANELNAARLTQSGHSQSITHSAKYPVGPIKQVPRSAIAPTLASTAHHTPETSSSKRTTESSPRSSLQTVSHPSSSRSPSIHSSNCTTPDRSEGKKASEHAAGAQASKILSPSKMGKATMSSVQRTCTDPDFIQDYFQQSRLHHLSTWKAELLQKVSILSETSRAASKNVGHARVKKLKGDESDKRIIMHVDFDCFFIAAGLISQPELRGKPLAVCHAKANTTGTSSTSEIASCSYEARAFGVRNGHTLGKARELCPEIQTMAYDFELYQKISFKFYNILLSYADELQAVSVDECLIDVSSRFVNRYSGTHSLKAPVLILAEEIRRTIREQTQCDASIGASHNILLAKLATKKAKPAGSFYLCGSQCQSITKELDIDDLPGFGWAQRREIEEKLQISKVGELHSVTLSKLIETLGPARGKTLHQYSRGIDDRPLKSTGQDRKSVSAVVNYGIRFKSAGMGGIEEARNFVQQLGMEVGRRLTDLGVRGRHLTVKIMKRAANAPIETKKFLGHGVCEELNKTAKLAGPSDSAVDDGKILGEEAWKLIASMQILPEDLRGIGIQVQRLEKAIPMNVANKSESQLTLMFPATKPVDPAANRRLRTRSSTTDVQGKSDGASLERVVTAQYQPVASTSKRLIQTPEILSPTLIAVPPASQLDMDVIEALPTLIKSHILKSIMGAREKDLKSNGAAKGSGPQAPSDMVTPLNKKRPMTSSRGDPAIPSASQVDWKVLAELPSSVRKPIEAMYARDKRARFAAPPPPPPNFGRKTVNAAVHTANQKSTDTREAQRKNRSPAKLHVSREDKRGQRRKRNTSHRVCTIGPSQRLISKNSFKLITQPVVKAQEAGDAEEEREFLPTPNRISDEQLEALKIDVRFFRELQGARGFQLDMIYDQFQLHGETFKAVTKQTDEWKRWRTNFGKPSKVLTIEIPAPARIAGTSNGAGMSRVEEVAGLMEEWVESYRGYDEEEIEPADVARIERFLVDTIDKQRGSGQDLEKVCKIMAWWEDLVGCENSKSQARWVKIMERIKGKINEICERDHGAKVFFEIQKL